MNSERQQINSNAGIHHTLSRQILGTDWYDTESSARRVIEWLAEGQEPVGYVVEKRTGSLTALSGVIRASAILEDFVTDGTPLYAAPVSEAKAQGVGSPIRFWIIGDAGQKKGATLCKKSSRDGSLAFFETEEDATRAAKRHAGTAVYSVDYYKSAPLMMPERSNECGSDGELTYEAKAQEPIGWYTEDHLDDKSATTYSWTVAERWVEKGWPVSPLYAAPAAPAADAGLVYDKELHEAWTDRLIDLTKSYREAADGGEVRDAFRAIKAHIEVQPMSMAMLTDEARVGVALQRKEIDRLKHQLRDEGDRVEELRACLEFIYPFVKGKKVSNRRAAQGDIYTINIGAEIVAALAAHCAK